MIIDALFIAGGTLLGAMLFFIPWWLVERTDPDPWGNT